MAIAPTTAMTPHIVAATMKKMRGEFNFKNYLPRLDLEWDHSIPSACM